MLLSKHSFGSRATPPSRASSPHLPPGSFLSQRSGVHPSRRGRRLSSLGSKVRQRSRRRSSKSSAVSSVQPPTRRGWRRHGRQGSRLPPRSPLELQHLVSRWLSWTDRSRRCSGPAFSPRSTRLPTRIWSTRNGTGSVNTLPPCPGGVIGTSASASRQPWLDASNARTRRLRPCSASCEVAQQFGR